MNWIKKLIPAYIEIRSLYWVEYGIKMELALEKIFRSIDEEELEEAENLIAKFESTFSQGGLPGWIAIKYSEIYRASSMLACLKA